MNEKKPDHRMNHQIQDMLFGLQSAAISTMGLVAGVQSATADPKYVIIAGASVMFTGGLAAVFGAYILKAMTRFLARAVLIYISYLTGAFVVILPYVLIDNSSSFVFSLTITALILFVAGAYRSFLAGKPHLSAGLEFATVGVGCAAIGWCVGMFLQ